MESELLNELLRRNLRLEATPTNQRPAFPFGQRAQANQNLSDLVDANNGALYLYCNNTVTYGGQTKQANPNRTSHKDALTQFMFENLAMTFVPISSVPRADLLKQEAHFITGLFLAY